MGKPNQGTKPDRRLSENRPSPKKSHAPNPKPTPRTKKK